MSMNKSTKARPDKQKVIDEVWDSERIASFLNTEVPYQSGRTFEGDRDFYILLRAYRSMRVQDFEEFLSMFERNGGDFNAVDGNGKTIEDVLSSHTKAHPYVEALRKYRVVTDEG